MKKILLSTFIILVSIPIVVSGDPIDPISQKALAQKTLSGTWRHSKVTNEDGERWEEFFRITRREDGSITIEEASLEHGEKSFFQSERNGRWFIEGSYYYEVTPEGTDKYKIMSVVEDRFRWVLLDSLNDVVSEREVNPEDVQEDLRVEPSYSLPDPPKGYTAR